WSERRDGAPVPRSFGPDAPVTRRKVPVFMHDSPRKRYSAAVAKLSPRTKQMFREHLVGTTLSYIADVFEGAGLRAVPLPEGKVIGGQRRTFVEEFYAGINWLDANHERRLLAAYTHILKDIPRTDRL